MRVIVQILLSVGVLPFYPYLLILAVAFFAQIFRIDISSFTFENFIGQMISPAAALGIPALFVSIFASPASVMKRRFLRSLIIIGLISGSILAVTLLIVFLPGDISRRDWRALFSAVWQIGGPLIVASWNLCRLFKEPNKSYMATPTSPSISDVSN